MSQARERLLNVTILNALDACGDYALPEESLLQQVALTVPGEPRVSEIRLYVNRLEGQRLIVSTPGELGGAAKYAITESGRLKLRGLNL